MDTALASYIRIKNAKVQLQERGARVGKGRVEVDETAKRKLEEIEQQAIVEEDPQKLDKLFEQYRLEYVKVNGEIGSENKKRRTEEPETTMHEQAGGSGEAPMYVDAGVRQIEVGEANPWDLIGKVQDDGEVMEEKYWTEVAWDDVNDIELPWRWSEQHGRRKWTT